jgi:hypothetical protein
VLAQQGVVVGVGIEMGGEQDAEPCQLVGLLAILRLRLLAAVQDQLQQIDAMEAPVLESLVPLLRGEPQQRVEEPLDLLADGRLLPRRCGCRR